MYLVGISSRAERYLDTGEFRPSLNQAIDKRDSCIGIAVDGLGSVWISFITVFDAYCKMLY